MFLMTFDNKILTSGRRQEQAEGAFCPHCLPDPCERRGGRKENWLARDSEFSALLRKSDLGESLSRDCLLEEFLILRF